MGQSPVLTARVPDRSIKGYETDCQELRKLGLSCALVRDGFYSQMDSPARDLQNILLSI